jgi:NhaP-type Na+/H+ or K+/H+ antiporter
MDTVILALGVLVFLGHLLLALFNRTRVPDVLLLMGVGVALGPYTLGWVKPAHFGEVGPALTTIALIVILFEGGVGMTLDALRRSLGGAASLSLAASAITIALVALASLPELGSWLPAFLVGAILSGTSSAVVMPMIAALRLGEKPRTILALESALTDVTCIVLTFGLLDAAVRGEFAWLAFLRQASTSLVMAAVIGIAGGFAWLVVLERVRRFPNSLFTIFAFIFIIYGIAQVMGFSGAITALAFGVTVAHLSRPDTASTIGGYTIGRITDTERGLFAEMVFLFKLFFFIYLGISLRFDNLGVYVLAGTIVGIVYLSRVLVVRFLLPRDASVREAAVASVMAPKGLAAAVLASLVEQAGVPGGAQIKELVFAVVLVSIVVTSLAVPILELPPCRWLAGFVFRPFARQGAATQPALNP